MMKLIADDKIPGVTEYFTECGTIIQLPAEIITQQQLQDTDILLVRTVTSVQASLLAGTSVQFLGSAATGTDHIDTQWLAKQNIALATAAGANAQAVAEYVLACVAAVKKQGFLGHKNPIAGIVGYGRIGRTIAKWLKLLGFEILCHDPFITDCSDFAFTSLSELITESHLITIHTPLTKTGLHPTYHLIGSKELSMLQKDSVLINTARGAVVDNMTLLKHDHFIACLDVFENEPYINKNLMDRLLIATPHIAGYSALAKIKATEIIYQQAARQFGWPLKIMSTNNYHQQYTLSILNHTQWITIFSSAIDLLLETQKLCDALIHTHDAETIKTAFLRCRNHYVLREELLVSAGVGNSKVGSAD